MSSYGKYLKYKKKYIDLRDRKRSQTMMGGDIEWEKRNELLDGRRNELVKNKNELVKSGNELWDRRRNEFMDRRNELRDRRRIKGGAGVFPIEDEIWFWGRQMTEHALILHLGLEDEEHKLKNEAKQIYNDWLDFMQKNFWKYEALADPKKYFLTECEVQSLRGKIDTKELEKLLTNITEFKQKVVDQLNLQTEIIKQKQTVVEQLSPNGWKGWIFPSLALHVLKEAQYFAEKISPSATPMSPEEEINWINQHNTEEIGTTAQLIDPAPENGPVLEKARAYAAKKLEGVGKDDEKWTEGEVRILQGMDVEEVATMLRLSTKYSKELTDFAKETGEKIDTRQLKSIIAPFLANHVFREFARFTLTLERLRA